MFETIVIVNISASLFMTGLSWFVQVVQYPGFHHIPTQHFPLFHSFHISRTGALALPVMLTEAGTSVWLTTAFDPFWIYNSAGLGLVAGIWLSTFALQVRYHRKLRFHISPGAIRRLTNSNWVRTLLWSAKSALGIFLLLQLT